MIDLPKTRDTPLVRTDYSDEAAWRDLIDAVRTPSVDGFLSQIEIVEAPRLAGIDPSELMWNYAGRHALMIVVDSRTLSDPIRPILCVDVKSGRSLRVVPSELWSIENNLSLHNMDFDEFVEAADEDGIYRGC